MKKVMNIIKKIINITIKIVMKFIIKKIVNIIMKKIMNIIIITISSNLMRRVRYFQKVNINVLSAYNNLDASYYGVTYYKIQVHRSDLFPYYIEFYYPFASTVINTHLQSLSTWLICSPYSYCTVTNRATRE